MFIAKNNDLIILAKGTKEELEQALQFMRYTSIEETDIEYQLYNGKYLTPEEIQEEEQKRVANLHLTRGDVFRGLLLAKGVTRADIRGLIETMPEETPEEKMAKEYALIDFDEALEFYRGVALIDTLGSQLGIKPKQMDRFFDTGDWKELINIEIAGE